MEIRHGALLHPGKSLEILQETSLKIVKPDSKLQTRIYILANMLYILVYFKFFGAIIIL